jgi:ring-1,2-phenylacetyl-CoA epoxidase subunit PaaE
VVVTLRPPEGADFTFRPGQYLTFRRDFDGQEIRRTYSICSGLDDRVLQVGIKRVDGGAFSTFANENMAVGDTLQVMPPTGRFTVDIDPDAAHNYLAFAGGSGITPVLSLIRSVLAREPKSRFTLVYANRRMNTIMFREEIEDLKNLHMGRLRVIHVLEQDAQEIELFTGRVTEEKCGDLFRDWIDVSTMDMALDLRAGADDAGDRAGAGGARHAEGPDPVRAVHLRRAAGTPAAARGHEGGGEGQVHPLSVTLDGATRDIRDGARADRAGGRARP